MGHEKLPITSFLAAFVLPYVVLLSVTFFWPHIYHCVGRASSTSMHECFCNLRRFFLPSRFFWCRHKKWGLTVTPYPNESGTIIWKNLEFTFMIWFEKCRLGARKKLAQLGFFPPPWKDPYFLLAPSIDAGPRDSVSLQNTQKRGRSQLFFLRVFFSYCSYLLHCAFVYLAARVFCWLYAPPKWPHLWAPYFCQST